MRQPSKGIEPYNAASMDAQVLISAKWIAPIAALVTVRLDRGAVLTVLLGLMTLPCVGRAQGTWSGSIGGTSNYVYRGISQTYNGAALQLGGSYQSPLGWFAGAWGSNVNPYPGGASFEELDFYGGLIRSVGSDFAVKGTYTHYLYVQDPRPARYDYDEIAVSVAYLDVVAATVSYQPNYTSYSELGFAYRRPATAYELTGRWPLRFGFAATAGAGYYDLHHLFGVGYWAGDVGLAYVYRRLTLGVSRFFADTTAATLYEDASANGNWAVSATWRF
ncbi:MAG: TorF family putative porin [Steroidobacteraceae bacterium]